MGALVVGVCVVSGGIAVLTFRSDAAAYIHPEFFLPDLVLGMVYGPFGAYLAARSRHPIGWALGLGGLGFALSGFGIQLTVLAAERGWAIESLAASLTVSAWLPGALLAILVLPWLTRAGPPSRAALAGAWLGLAVAMVGGLVKFLSDVPGGPPHAFVPEPLSEAIGRVDTALAPVYVVLAVPGAVHLVRRLAAARGAERRALWWIFGSFVVLATAYVLFEIGLAIGGGVTLSAAAPLLFVAQMMLVAGTFALVVQGASWTTDLAFSRSIVAALIGGVVMTAYILLVWAGSRALPMADGTVGLIAVAAVALGVSPLRSWVQRRVDQLVFGSGAEVSRLLADLGHGLKTGRSDGDLLADLADGLRSGLRLRRVEVTSLPDGPWAAAGRPADPDLILPLHSRGAEVGRIALTAPTGQRLDPRTVGVVSELSGLVAIAVELATANQQLEQARQRVLDVRHEERRLLRRELHDGLGPSLSGAALALAAIANTSALRPADAALLDQVGAELNRRADDVRQMARVLLPPALEVGRLEEALRDLAGRFTDDRFAVTISTSGVERLPEQHRVAAYHIAAEGVRNAHRHAGARRCQVRVDVGADGATVLTVEDDGTGVDPLAAPGVGLSSMRERAAELGGSFDLVSDERGARVTVVLP